ncbi:MAG: binding-protein-dependent transport system inner rane Component:tumor necrosis factor, partial [candidate division NC10 bacterium]|nr:binding-protein-dependent transport system inner rane Component:tumor necrosis factor [candidate division NC10 bacterium]
GMTAFWRKHSVHGITLFLLLPGLLCFFGLFFYPMLLTVVLSFRPEGQEVGWTLENYTRFLSDADGRWVILLTFILSLASTGLSVLLSVPLALTLRAKVRGHRFYRLMVLVPLVIPGLIGALGLLLFWGSRGWFNLLLLQFVPGVTTPLRINYTVQGLIFFYVWLYFPYTCVTTMSALESLDPAIEEAGAVTGANRWQVLRYIVLPLITPGILAGSVLTFMSAFGAFSVPLIAGGDYRPLAVEIYKQISIPIPARWSAASAIAMVMGVLQVAFLAVYMRIARRTGGNAGGVR